MISKFETLIRSGDDLSLYRVNPLAFARDRGIAEAESIDLFLHATRSGLFEMSWDVVCPQSGMVLDSFGALRTLKTHYVCGLCDVTGETDLDDFIEVTFTVSPQLRRLPFHDPDSLSVEDFHWKLRFLNNGRIPGQQVRFLDILQGIGSRPRVLAARLHHHASGRSRSRCSVGRQCPDAGRVHGADRSASPTTTPTLLAGQIRWAALFVFAVRCAARSRRHRSGELRSRARLVASDQLAAGNRRSDDQAAARLRSVHVRRDAACETDFPAPVPVRTRRRDGRVWASGR